MPEGPEVEKLRLQLDRAWRGKQFTKIESIWDSMKSGKYWNGGSLLRIEFEKHLQNRTVRGVLRVGKWLLVKSPSDVTLFAFHLGGTGWFLPNPVDKYPLAFPYENFLHKVNEIARRLSFKMKDVMTGAEEMWDFYDGRTWAEFITTPEAGKEPWAGYGPDWLYNPDLAIDKLRRYGRRSTKKVKDVLCDQHIAAGIGNYLACEALWRANIHPHRRWRDLGQSEVDWLCVKLKLVTEIAQGSMTHDWWGVFKLKGKLCKSCIQQRVQSRVEYVKDPGGSRGSYFCPRCQPQSGEVVPEVR